MPSLNIKEQQIHLVKLEFNGVDHMTPPHPYPPLSQARFEIILGMLNGSRNTCGWTMSPCSFQGRESNGRQARRADATII